MENPTIEEKLGWSLEQKISHALMTIDQFYHTMDGKCYIGFSGGKDSCLLRYLVNKFTDMCGYDRLKCVFNNTTNEHQDILEFVKSFGEEVIWIRPKMTFAQSLLKNGYPLISKEQAQYISEAKSTKSDKLRDIRMNGKIRISKNGNKYKSGKIADKWKFLVDEDINLTHKCCDILKKEPAKRFEKETGLHPIIGTTAMGSEGTLRLQRYVMNGGQCNIFDGNRPKSKPLSIFTEDEIWAAIRIFDIEYCKIYDDQIINGQFVRGEKRTGCAYCAFGLQFEKEGDTKFDRNRIREPNRYHSIMDKLGYREALHKAKFKLGDDPIFQLKLFGNY